MVLHGTTGCNNYFGGMKLDGSALTVDQVGDDGNVV